MKRILLFSFGCLVTLTLAGQRSDYPGHWNEGSRLTSHEQYEETSRRSFRHAVHLPALLKSAANMMVVDSFIRYRWEDASSTWGPDLKAYYDFNEDGLIIEFWNQEWNGTSGSWELDDLETYEYNEHGDLMLLLDYDPSETDDGWDISWKREYTYQDGRVSEYTESLWDAEGEFFDPIWRVVVQYDDAGRMSGTREFIHTLAWRETWRTEYIYDANGNPVTFIDYDDSDSEPSGWEYAWKEEYTYGDDGYLDLYEEFEWDEDNDLWLNSDREEYMVAANGDVESYIDYDWSDEGSAWELSWKGEYEYDTEYPYDRLYLPFFFRDDIPNFFNHRLTGYTSFMYEAGEWMNNYSGEYHYTELGATGYNPAMEKKVLLYPNPVTEMLHIRVEGRRLKQVELFDMTGRKVLSARIDGGNSVNLGMLDHGAYFCRVTDSNDREVVSQMILITGE